jgi:mRNA interferase MazF
LAAFRAGELVVADWRDALPKEPNKRRPAIVVGNDELFDDAYPTMILAPLTQDARLAISGLTVVIEPNAENGLAKRSFALAHFVAATSATRVRATSSRITPEQLLEIRQKIAMSIGLE